MVKFSNFVVKEWNLSKEVAKKICEHFEKGDSVYYLCDYVPLISAEVDAGVLSDIFNTLTTIKGLSSKKKRVLNAYSKAQVLTKDVEKRITLSTSSLELDDMLLPYRPNSRSRGQQAIKKGLGPLADLIDDQETEEGSVEELAQEYVGKDNSLKTVEDVLEGVKDILIERYAHDETVRSMVREVGFENGFFEILPKVKKDKRFLVYRGKMVSVNDFTPEEYLTLCKAEQDKQIRFKHGVQLFHINELLRHHFITNPDSIGYDLICEVIDVCWSRVLQPIVERDVKARLLQQAEDRAVRTVDEELHNKINDRGKAEPLLAVGKFNTKNLVLVAISGEGNLLGAANEVLTKRDSGTISNRISQFYSRHRPKNVVIMENDFAEAAHEIVTRSLGNLSEEITIKRQAFGEERNGLINSQWMQERCAVLEKEMKQMYALGLAVLRPLSIIPQIGIAYFSIHPLQKFIHTDRLEHLLNLRITQRELHKGVPYLEAPESVLRNITCVPKTVLGNIRKAGAKKSFTEKVDLLQVEGMTEQIFRNIAGYIIIPNAPNSLDRTLVHPDFYTWLNEISLQLNASLESLLNDPDRLRSVACDDFSQKVFLDQKLPEHLRAGQKYPQLVKGDRHRRKQRLSELTEGTVISGRVTNITKFGVFVDINAVCDGLIHISQLADEYVETAEQVVKPNEPVDVRILKIDKKKRRVSLSMKKMGSKAPKIRPSEGQLTNLADHFKNR